MKRLFSVFLCLAVWLSVSAYDFEVDGIYCNIIGNGQVEVTYQSYDDQNYTYNSPYSGNFIVPSSIAYNSVVYNITSIGNSAFRGCNGLISVTMPNSVTSIGDDAFTGCISLTSVTISNSVTSIGKWAFYGCSGLTSVTIPNSVNSIDSCAFYYCSGLKSMTIGNSVISIGDCAFYWCSGLTSVTIPNSVTSIGKLAFNGCSGLTSLTIPNNVTFIGERAFDECTSLTSISVDANNVHYDSRNNCNAIIETSTNTLITGCMNSVIPNSVTSIGDYAFTRCFGLTSVTIPNSVTSIGKCAFICCSSLTSVAIPNSVTSIGPLAFSDCSGLTSVSIGSGVTDIEGGTFAECANIVSITCCATTPPTIRGNTFANYDAILYVPLGSVELYSAKPFWKNFHIQPISEEPTQLDYNSVDKNVVYCNHIIYNINALDIMLFDASGRLISSGNGNIEMSSCPNGIYIVTDGKGGFLKINHYR